MPIDTHCSRESRRGAMALLCLVWCALAAAAWDNPVLNYGREHYGMASQTWDIDGSNDAFVFFAHRQGVMAYDGHRWDVYPLPGNLDVRSVHVSADNSRVYCGGINEYGYLEPEPSGRLRYVSLSDSLHADLRNALGNVWAVYEHSGSVYFCGDRFFVRHTPGQPPVRLDVSGGIDFSARADGALYAANSRGLHILVGDTFMPIHGTERLADKRIRGVLPHPGRGFLVVTAHDGMYYCDGLTALPYPTAADSYLRRAEAFCAARRGSDIAIGTINGGVVVIGADGTFRHWDESTGLANNTVLSVAFAGDGTLWAGLDRGIAAIRLNTPFTGLNDTSLGAGYAARVHGGDLYLGTNRGLWRIRRFEEQRQRQRPEVEPVAGITGQVWDLCEIDGRLYCTGDRGIWHVEAAGVRRASDLPGAWTLLPLSDSERVLAGRYNGLWVLERTDGGMLRTLW